MKRIPELDGLRCFAVGAVIAVHYRPPQLSLLGRLCAMGFVGVDLFFAISGFLITSILLTMRGTNHPYRIFYTRRSLRIFPPYFLVLTLICSIAVWQHLFIPKILGIGGFFFATSLGPAPFLAMIHNLFVRHGLDHTVAPMELHQLQTITEGLFVIWSLSVEEIFYLIWAPIVLRVPVRKLFLLTALPIVLCPLFRIAAHTAEVPEYTSFFFRADSLCTGAVIALCVAGLKERPHALKIFGNALAALLAVACVSLYWIMWRRGLQSNLDPRSTLLFASIGYTSLAFASAAIVGLCAVYSGSKNLGLRMLRLRVVTFLGTISYMLYLIHIPSYVAVHSLLSKLGLPANTRGLEIPLALALAIGAASLSWQYFEGPIMAWKERQFRRSPGIEVGASDAITASPGIAAQQQLR
jgi:peptidoglycan/LPS O-acetylase OafA/YrhL